MHPYTQPSSPYLPSCHRTDARQAKRARALVLLAQGVPRPAICSRLGLSPSALSRYAQEAGADVSPRMAEAI